MSLDQYLQEAFNSTDAYQQQVVNDLIQWSHQEADRFGLPEGGLNDERDAFRHALISASLANWLGGDVAKYLMDEYENSNPNTPEEHNMDYWNNDVGRQIADEVPFLDIIDVDLSQRIYDAIQDGRLITDINDERAWVEPRTWFDDFIDQLDQGFNDLLDTGINTYNQFTNWVWQQSPLALDLDGDGIETLAANGYGGVLFDHNGDGIKRATGWVAPDDGLLVLDRNGNGTIDNGSELFGDNTPSAGTASGTAADGFIALEAMDSNLDGVIDTTDAQFADLRVWRDMNSDGISQSNELFTLDELGITSLNTGGTNKDAPLDLGNGNTIQGEGDFTWADGSQGYMADVYFEEQAAYREFTDEVAITAEAQALPDVVATGAMRDLREAMSMSGGSSLTTIVDQISTATTRAEQQSQLDNLLSTWAATSGFETSPGTSNKIRMLINRNVAASNDAIFCYKDNDIKLAMG